MAKKRLWVVAIMIKRVFKKCKAKVENSLNGSIYWIDCCFDINDISFYEVYTYQGIEYPNETVITLKNGTSFTSNLSFDEVGAILDVGYFSIN